MACSTLLEIINVTTSCDKAFRNTLISLIEQYTKSMNLTTLIPEQHPES